MGAEREWPTPVRKPAGPASPQHDTEQSTSAARPLLAALQPHLRVGRADDPFEREADLVAEQVVRTLSSGTGRWPHDGASSRIAPAASGNELPPTAPATPVSRIARSIRRRPASQSGPLTAPMGRDGGVVDDDIERRLGRARGSGTPLDGTLRRSMEGAFGADFGRVRVHSGSEPAALNRAIGAEAFTIGSDIFFGARTPDTATPAGQRLVAHELTHTLQQGGAGRAARTIRRDVVDQPTVEAVPEAAESVTEASGGAAPDTEPAGETVAEGTTPEVSLPVEQTVSTGPPPGMVADATGSGSTRGGPSSVRSSSKAVDERGATTYRIDVSNFSSRTTLSRLSAMPDVGESDAVSAKVSAKSKLSSGAAVGPFGALNSGYSTSKVKWKAKKSATAGNSISLGFALNLASQWGTSNGGRTDIKSASASAITADNYATVVSDLTPGLQDGSWVAPRTQFWSDKICQRHEKYHYKDVSKWFKKTGAKLVADDLDGKSIAVGATDDKSVIGTKVQQLVQTSIATITNAHIVFMNGTGQTYYNYPGEIRAFGDGKKPYETLAKGVEKRGKALVKKRDKKAGS